MKNKKRPVLILIVFALIISIYSISNVVITPVNSPVGSKELAAEAQQDKDREGKLSRGGEDRNKNSGESEIPGSEPSKADDEFTTVFDPATIDKEKFKNKSITIDPGHGGSDCGACYEEDYEKEIALDISLTLGSLLEQCGIKVLYTRKTDEYVTLKKRTVIANEANSDLFISVHCNSLEDASGNGTETLYDTHRKADKKSEYLAQILQRNIVGAIKTKNNGTYYKPRLYVLNSTKMTAALVEVGYISNINDREKLCDPIMRRRAAEAVASGVIEFFTYY